MKITRRQLRRLITETVIPDNIKSVIQRYAPKAFDLAMDQLFYNAHDSLKTENSLFRRLISNVGITGVPETYAHVSARWLTTNVLPLHVRNKLGNDPSIDPEVRALLDNDEYYTYRTYLGPKEYLPKEKLVDMTLNHMISDPALSQSLEKIKQTFNALNKFNEAIIAGQVDENFESMVSTGNPEDYKNAFELYSTIYEI
jgi:hypothetical protein